MKKLLLFILLFTTIQIYALQNLYMKHTIAKGETIYSLTKMYEVSIEDIKKVNPGININSIKIGETINIPLKTKEIGQNSTTPPTTTTKPENPNKYIYHTVKSGESLYSIAKKYGITINDITKLNGITDNAIKIGQYLKIATDASNNTFNSSTTTIKKASNTNIDEDVTDPTLKPQNTVINNPIIKEAPKNTATNSNIDYYNTKTVATGKTQKGIGMSMSDSGENTNYIALYTGAAIGSMITIKNLMNGKTITAKVVGKIPSLDRNKDVLVKISINAYNDLGAIDEKFLVEVIY